MSYNKENEVTDATQAAAPEAAQTAAPEAAQTEREREPRGGQRDDDRQGDDPGVVGHGRTTRLGAP